MIRLATPADAALVAGLNHHLQSWHAAHYPDVFFASIDQAALTQDFHARLSAPETICFLAGDPALGYALCSLQSRPRSLFSPAIRRLMVDHIAVAPAARRQGHARALLTAARAHAKALECDEILLDTWEGNHEAHAFFRAMGFAPRRMLFRATP